MSLLYSIVPYTVPVGTEGAPQSEGSAAKADLPETTDGELCVAGRAPEVSGLLKRHTLPAGQHGARGKVTL